MPEMMVTPATATPKEVRTFKAETAGFGDGIVIRSCTYHTQTQHSIAWKSRNVHDRTLHIIKKKYL